MILKELSEAMGVSGNESAVRSIIIDAIKDHVQNLQIDALGSVTALVRGTGEKKRLRVMIAAHMDEIGFMVTGIDSSGLIRFQNVGGIDARILPGLRVRIGADAIPGVIIWTPIHQNRDQKTVSLDNLRIDTGATEKNGRVKRGDYIVFDSRFMELGASTLRGKAFDDRVGCSLLVDIIQGGPYPVDVLVAFTVQEEIGLRGARVAAQTLNPDMAIVLEGTTAHDLPDPSGENEPPNPATRFGAGPALTVMDRSMIADPRLLGFLRQTAEANDIPYQIKTALGGGTDAGSIHLSNSGVPSAVISMPCRYIHSPAALLHRDDYASGLKLVQAALNNLTPAVLERG